MFLGSNSNFVGWEKSLKFLSTLELNSSSYFLIHFAMLVCCHIALTSCLSEKKKKKKVQGLLFKSIETVQKCNRISRIHAVMELAADLQQLLWGLYVPMVVAFQSHSTPKGLTWATGEVMNTFCPTTEWSGSGTELKGVFQEMALEPAEWVVLVCGS